MDESKWVWGNCPGDNIDFKELWRFVRGGGHGIGVHLKTYIVLQPYPGPLKYLTMPWGEGNSKERPKKEDEQWFHENKVDPTWCGAIDPNSGQAMYTMLILFSEFNIIFGLDPGQLNVAEVDAYSCGHPFGFPFNRYCYGQSAVKAQIDAWKDFLDWTTVAERMAEVFIDLSEHNINKMKKCYDITDFEDYGEMTLTYAERIGGESTSESRWTYPNRPEGTLPADTPGPMLSSSTGPIAPLLVSKAWILENVTIAAAMYTSAYNGFGGYDSKTSDQADAIPEAYRKAGYWTLLSLSQEFRPGLLGFTGGQGLSQSALDTEFLQGDFRDMYKIDLSTAENFPGVLSHNHVGSNIRGPLKKDWTTACDINWTQEKRDEECMSSQEMTFGTELLKELEAIKEKVDPNGTLICRSCIMDNVKDSCKDNHENCYMWSVEGECERNPVYMKVNCALSCQSCDLPEKYALFGNGGCMGLMVSAELVIPATFNSIRFNVDSLKDCSRKCQSIGNLDQHTGFSYTTVKKYIFPYWANCWCHWSRGGLPYVDPNTTPDYAGWDSPKDHKAIGPIIDTNVHYRDDTTCWRHKGYRQN